MAFITAPNVLIIEDSGSVVISAVTQILKFSGDNVVTAIPGGAQVVSGSGAGFLFSDMSNMASPTACNQDLVADPLLANWRIKTGANSATALFIETASRGGVDTSAAITIATGNSGSGGSGAVSLIGGSSPTAGGGINIFGGPGTNPVSSGGTIQVFSGGGGDSGAIIFQTSNGTSSSGQLSFTTGASLVSGGMFFNTGTSSTSPSGDISFQTGSATGVVKSGAVVIKTGNSLANTSGNIELTTGNGGAGRGDVVVDANTFIVPLAAADPAGVNGAMYYNTVSNKFRGFAGGVWTDLN